MKVIRLFILILVIMTFISNGHSQTSSWKIEWDKNAMTDSVSHYIIFRDTQPSASSQIAQVEHSDIVTNMEYTDSPLEKGTIYYYRLKAENERGLQSGFSQEVSAAIPDILENNPIIVDTSLASDMVNLDDYVDDPDQDNSTLTWTATSTSNLNISISGSQATISRINANWPNNEQVSFRVEDSDSFFDIENLVVSGTGIIDTTDNNELKPEAYPVPFMPDENSTLTFRNLSSGGKLLIYDIMGNLVFKTTISGSTYNWNGLNKAGKEVDSGVYIYLVKNNSNKKVESDKFILVR